MSSKVVGKIVGKFAELFAVGALTVFAGCQKDPPPPPPTTQMAQAATALDQAGKKLQAASKEVAAGTAGGEANMAEAMKAMGMALNGGKKVDPVSFKDLKALLPEELPGWKRKETKGEKNGAMGLSISQADGRYDGEGGATLRIKIVDAGSLTGPIGIGLAGWASIEIDRETDDEYEKSTTFGGYKAFEKYNSKEKTGEMKLLLAGRFIVEVRGHGVKIDDIKGALGKLDLKKLESLK
jgi:hypothetical protein